MVQMTGSQNARDYLLSFCVGKHRSKHLLATDCSNPKLFYESALCSQLDPL